MKRGIESFFGNAALAGGVLSKQIHGDFSDQVEIFGSMAGPCSTSILLEGTSAFIKPSFFEQLALRKDLIGVDIMLSANTRWQGSGCQ